MARTRTLLELRTDVRRRADQVGSGFITDAELTELINQSNAELYDLLVAARGQDYYEATKTFQTVQGQQLYPFAAMAPPLTDFYQMIQVECLYGGVRAPLRAFSRQEHGLLTWNTTVGGRQIDLIYVPACPRLVADGDTFDGINGWEEYSVVDAAAKIMEKEESDASALYKRKAELTARIQNLAPDRDAGQTERIQMQRRSRNPYQVFPMPLYRLRGNTIEILEDWTAGVP